MKRTKPPGPLPAYRSDCPIHMALAVLGDSWSLLVVRDLMFRGRSRFKDFLEAEERISSNVLADRLACLESAGILAKTPDPEDGRRSCYRLTERGIDLAPLMIEMVLWSARHFETGAPAEQLAAMRERPEQVLQQVRERWRQTQPAG